jgi:hydroxysqualene dehydroxylase
VAVSNLTSPDVLVIGGGCAGLSAAVRLAQRGKRVLVLEARSRLGGRATAFADRDTGEWVDNGQHVLLGCYRDTFAFLEAIGASHHLHRPPRLAVDVVDRDGTRSRLVCPALPSPWHLLVGAFRWPALDWRDRRALLRMARPLRDGVRHMQDASRPAPVHASETVGEWLDRLGQTRRLRDLLWDPLALAALNQPPEVATAGPFSRVLAEMFGGGAGAAAIVLPAVPLHELFGEPARTFLDAHGGEVINGATAVVHVEHGAVTHVTARDRTWSVRTVVVAVPWFALSSTISGDVATLGGTFAAARDTKASPIVTVNLWYDRAVIDVPFVGLPGRTFQWVFDKRLAFGGAAAHLSLVASGEPELLGRANDDLIATADRELRESLPRAAAAKRLKATVIREPRATFSLAPGQPLRPAAATGVSGLWLAGDWIDTALPATIEGAVRSGHEAADQILNS